MAKDILFIISDQHSYKLQGYAGDKIVRTPNLDRLAQQGTVMNSCYSPCPLCVPARLSMLSGRYPSEIKALTNDAMLDSTVATFVHSLNAGGYDTTLCGRMHFIGPDQRHGFTKRLVGDITPTTYEKGWKKRDGVGALPWNRGRIEHLAIQCMGGGDSTVLEFDRDVTTGAIEYLSHDYEKPQFLCVGMYAPHFPYIAPKEYFDYYYDKVKLPEESYEAQEHPVFEGKLRDKDPETVRAAMAAYYGMVEVMDDNVGKVLKAFEEYLNRNGREGLVVYVSDHGDSNGEHGFYGKNTFFEPSVHVPMIFGGAGIPQGKAVNTPVSLLDVGPTLCELTGSPLPPSQRGISLVGEMTGEAGHDDRIVVSELSNRFGRESIGRMAMWQNYKFVTFSGFEGQDQLFDVDADPYEKTNIINEHQEIAAKLADYIRKSLKAPEQVISDIEELKANTELISRCVQDKIDEWQVRHGLAEDEPSPMISTKIAVSFR